MQINKIIQESENTQIKNMKLNEGLEAKDRRMEGGAPAGGLKHEKNTRHDDSKQSNFDDMVQLLTDEERRQLLQEAREMNLPVDFKTDLSQSMVTVNVKIPAQEFKSFIERSK